MLMPKSLLSQFRKAVEQATANLADVASGMGRGYRMLQAYQRKERTVTPDAARGLIAYLRKRGRQLARTADDLEAALEEHLNQEDQDV